MGALAVLAVVSLSGVGLWAIQRRLIYFPDDGVTSVNVMGPGWAEVELHTADGLTLGAWYRAPDAGQPVVVVFNGNAGNRADRAALGAGFGAVGWGVLLTDYRGYGGNPGDPTEDGLARDARAAIGFLHEEAAGVPLVYFGESLGAAVAIELATAEAPSVLLLRSPFTSLADVGRVHYPWLPVSALLKDRYSSLERIGYVAAPTLVLAGDADSIVPIGQSQEIYAAAPEPKHFVLVEGADHNDAELVSGASLIDEIVRFVNREIGS